MFNPNSQSEDDSIGDKQGTSERVELVLGDARNHGSEGNKDEEEPEDVHEGS